MGPEKNTPREPGLASELSVTKKLLFTALTFSIIVGLGEVACRLYYRGRFPTNMVYHPERGHTHRANWEGYEGRPSKGVIAKINDLGLRESKEIASTYDGKRVIVLGDSVAFGYRLAYEDTISSKLQASLAGPGESWQVINMGCYGYDLWDESHWLDELRPKLKCDLVLLCICYNDFSLGRKPSVAAPNALYERLAGHSALLMGVGRKIHQLRKRMSAKSARRHTSAAGPKPFQIPVEKVPLAASQAMAAIENIAKTARAMGANLAVAFWPGRDQFDTFAELKQLPPEQEALRNALLATMPEVKVLQPLPEISQAAGREELYMDHCHPTAQGVAAMTPLLQDLVKRSLGASSSPQEAR